MEEKKTPLTKSSKTNSDKQGYLVGVVLIFLIVQFLVSTILIFAFISFTENLEQHERGYKKQECMMNDKQQKPCGRCTMNDGEKRMKCGRY